MRRGWWRGVAWSALGVALVLACGGTEPRPPAQAGGEAPAEGTPDAGTPPSPGAPDAGTPDAGGPGGGSPDAGAPDAGAPDAGQALADVALPTVEGWTFYGRKQGAPADVYGVTEDAGGNLWVAGGEEGLFLLRKGRSTFERFTLEDGLRPYGYLPDGSEPPGRRHLKVLSVAGGPAGTVFVGYEGRPGCENNGHEAGADPSIYKSGDADRVELTADGIRVVHYDIFSGAGIVEGYPYREKICTVYRIAYDPQTASVWFGGNHGIARGDARHEVDPTCNGLLRCSGVEEHAHPHIDGPNGETVTDLYYGLAPAPGGDVWIGGANRSARFRYMTSGGGSRDFWEAQFQVEFRESNKLDLWTLEAGEKPQDRLDPKPDMVSAMAAMPDGSVWVSSFAWGLVHLDADGRVLQRALRTDEDRFLSALGRDPSDHSLWVGHRYGGGVTRMRGSTLTRYGPLLGELWGHAVWDIQAGTGGGGRRMLVAFRATETRTGAVGVYSGP